jgi:hypothetical protein
MFSIFTFPLGSAQKTSILSFFNAGKNLLYGSNVSIVVRECNSNPQAFGNISSGAIESFRDVIEHLLRAKRFSETSRRCLRTGFVLKPLSPRLEPQLRCQPHALSQTESE